MSAFDDEAWGVWQKGGSDNSTAANYTCGASSACNALPSAWGPGGYWVDVFPTDYDAYVVFTDQSDLTASVPTATAAGAQAVGLGKPCPKGVNTPLKVYPGCTYIARISPGGTNTSLLVSRSSEKQQSV